jgi:prevent-host-death family protein
MRVGLREANQNFSRLMQAVRRGTEVVLTDRGRPVARLIPIAAEPVTETAAALLRRLEEEGLLRRATKTGPLPAWKPRKITGVGLAAAVQAEREER